MTYYFDSDEFKRTGMYKNFMNIHDGTGILKVEASTASLAYPLSDVEIEVSKIFGEDKVIFYEGKTNESGIIESIILPTRKISKEIEDVSDIFYTTYDLFAKDSKYDVEKKYDVSIFDDIKVIQPVTFPVDELNNGEINE